MLAPEPRPRTISYLLLLLMVGMDTCVIYIASRVAHLALFAPLPEIHQGPEPMVLAGLEIGAMLLSALLIRWERIAERIASLILGLGGLATVGTYVLVMHPPLEGTLILEWLIMVAFTTVIATMMWTVGASRYSERVNFNDVYKTFRNGLVAIGLAVLLGSVLGERGGRMLGEIGSVPVWFFVWALAALGISNRELVREEAGESAVIKGGALWNLTIALSMGLVFLGGLLTGVVTGDNLAQALQGALIAVVFVVILPFYLAAYGIFTLLAILFEGMDLRLGPGEPRQGQSPFISTLQWLEQLREGFYRERPERPLEENLPFDVVATGTWIFIGLAVVAVVFFAGQGLRRLGSRDGKKRPDDRENIGSWGLLGRQLWSWVMGLLNRLRGGKPSDAAAAPDDLAVLRGRPEWQGTLSVREIYGRLQRGAGGLGYPRAQHQTAIEYLSVLSRAMPDLRQELSTITGAYIEARYGPLPASGPVVTAATQAWERAEAALRAAKEEKERQEKEKGSGIRE